MYVCICWRSCFITAKISSFETVAKREAILDPIPKHWQSRDIPSYRSQSERTKITFHRFGEYEYVLLTKRKVKMAGYWASSSRSIKTQERIRPVYSHLDWTSLVKKGFIIYPKRELFLSRNPDVPRLAHSRIQPYNKWCYETLLMAMDTVLFHGQKTCLLSHV